MLKGGYQILDLKGVSLTAGTASTIAGTYNAINKTSKMIVLSNLVIGSTKYHDTVIDVTVSSGKYVFAVYGYNFEITDADAVKATAITNGGK